MIKKCMPICLDEFSASEVYLYPQSRLALIDKCMLFSCRIIYAIYPTLSRRARVLAATTHVGLRRDETGDLEIFLTNATSFVSFSYNSAQPFGIWADLIPVETRLVVSLQKLGRKLILRQQQKNLAWLMITRSADASWLRELASHTDLMRMILRR